MTKRTKNRASSKTLYEKRTDRRRDDRKSRELALDKTLADSYPASDPPSTIPDPKEDSEAA